MTSQQVQVSDGKRSVSIAERLVTLMEHQEQGRQAAFSQMTSAHEKTAGVMEKMVVAVETVQNMKELREINPDAHDLLRKEDRREDQKQRRQRVKERKKAAEAFSTDGAPQMEEAKTVSCERVSASSQHSAQYQRGSSKSLACDGSRNQVHRENFAPGGRPVSKSHAKAIAEAPSLKSPSDLGQRSRSPAAHRHRRRKSDRDGDGDSESEDYGKILPPKEWKRRQRKSSGNSRGPAKASRTVTPGQPAARTRQGKTLCKDFNKGGCSKGKFCKKNPPEFHGCDYVDADGRLCGMIGHRRINHADHARTA